jgi:hypothetical protein
MTELEVNTEATDLVPVPDAAGATIVQDPLGKGPGHWAGGPSAALGQDGAIYLGYRFRRPFGEGRGFMNVVARSEDGERFQTLAELDRRDFNCESLERPALVVVPGGGWRVYVSCATPGTFHWRVDVLEASDPTRFDARSARTVLPGDDRTGVKDPVVLWHDGLWHMWLCCHPLEDPLATDRMWTRYGTSSDGIKWDLKDTALGPTPGQWDARGARVTYVMVDGDRWRAYYDGRATAEENAEELTGVAVGDSPDRLVAQPGPVAVSPWGTRSLRYLTGVRFPDGGLRLYYEASRLDGAHDLRTEYVPPSR